MTHGEKIFWGAFAVVVVAAVAFGLIWRVSHPIAATPSNFKATTVPAVTAADWATGNANAKVSLIEYGDFQCPACGAYEPIVERIRSQYGSQVVVVFRNFPLYQVHQNAGIAAQAAEAAGLQGKYWEMHDLLYTKQTEWSNTAPADIVNKNFNGYAQSLGLNVAKFDADINSAAVKNKIQKDVDSGNAAEIDHTPTFFVNLTQIPNPNSETAFMSVIQAAIASSTK